MNFSIKGHPLVRPVYKKLINRKGKERIRSKNSVSLGGEQKGKFVEQLVIEGRRKK